MRNGKQEREEKEKKKNKEEKKEKSKGLDKKKKREWINGIRSRFHQASFFFFCVTSTKAAAHNAINTASK